MTDILSKIKKEIAELKESESKKIVGLEFTVGRLQQQIATLEAENKRLKHELKPLKLLTDFSDSGFMTKFFSITGPYLAYCRGMVDGAKQQYEFSKAEIDTARHKILMPQIDTNKASFSPANSFIPGQTCSKLDPAAPSGADLLP